MFHWNCRNALANCLKFPFSLIISFETLNHYPIWCHIQSFTHISEYLLAFTRNKSSKDNISSLFFCIYFPSYQQLLEFWTWNFDLLIYAHHLRLFFITTAFVFLGERCNHTLPWFNIESSLLSLRRACCTRCLNGCSWINAVKQLSTCWSTTFVGSEIYSRTNTHRKETVNQNAFHRWIFLISEQGLSISICLNIGLIHVN